MFDPTTLVETCRKAAGTNVSACSNDDLLDAVAALEESRRALDAASCAVVAELDARDLPNQRFGHRTRDWIAAEHGLDKREAGRLCRVGRGLRGLDLIAAALADGRITLEHARVIVDATNPRVAHVITAAQAQLVRLAGTMRFEDWARHVRALVDHADTDGREPGPEKRSVTWAWLNGELHLRATLVGAAAAAVEHALETHTDRDTTNGDLEPPTRTQLRADAFDEILRAGTSALGGGTATAPAAEVTITVPHDHPALHGRHTGTTVCCGTGELSDTAAELMLCDPLFAAVVVDALGTPLDAGREERSANRAQRRALATRDGGCAFPGCDAPPRWCDAHHVTAWNEGGDTDMSNLLLLCRHHHGVIHRRGWNIRHVGDQHFEITTATGTVLLAQRGGRPPDTT